jgi:PhoH-like ATPase
MRKHYVLDTNILLHDPSSILHFADNIVIIPIEVIIEIDRFKHEISSRGQNAREVSRLLDQLRQSQSLAGGVTLPNGGTLRVHCGKDHAAPAKNVYADAEILRIAREIREGQPDARVIIVTKDINLRIRADALGLSAEDYTSDRVGPADLYTGRVELSEPPELISQFTAEGTLPLQPGWTLYPNEFVLMRSNNGTQSSVLGRVDATCTKLVRLQDIQKTVCGIRPKNKEQYFAFDALFCDDIKLVTLMGKAGTGKTLLAMAAGLYQVLIRKNYRGLLVTRPTTPVGKSIGYLPGGLEEKLAPWMRPITDTLETLLDAAGAIGGRKDVRELWANGMVDVQPLEYIRGRSIPKQFLIVDEAQNLTPLEVKTIITRVGHGTKVVLTGDAYQIDNPYVDSFSNGFNYLVSKFRAEPIAAHIELTKGERSQLAELAANLL